MASTFKRGGSRAKGFWYVSWFDEHGKRRTQCAKTTDKAAAERIAAKFEADAALRRTGTIDPTLEGIGKESRRPLVEHLDDFENKLRAAGTTPKHILHTRTFIEHIVAHSNIATAADICESLVNRYVSQLRKDNRSARTIGAYLAAIKQFTKWLVEDYRLYRDPLIRVKLPKYKADRRKERRMLLPTEWTRLEIATECGPERYGMTGPERRLLYATALQTGLRANEIRSLTRGQLFLAERRPFVCVRARHTKNRNAAKQIILPDLADELAVYVQDKSANDRVFSMPHESNTAKMLRADLAAARAAWLAEAKDDPKELKTRSESDFLVAKNHAGHVLDFHALRHTCGAWLSEAGVTPKAVQAIMRHSSIKLTFDVYGHLLPDKEAESVDRLRLMFPNTPTGEDRGETIDVNGAGPQRPDDSDHNTAQRHAQQNEREALPTLSNCFQADGAGSVADETPKSLALANLFQAFPNVSNSFQGFGENSQMPGEWIG